jgi:hypothetical protein
MWSALRKLSVCSKQIEGTAASLGVRELDRALISRLDGVDIGQPGGDGANQDPAELALRVYLGGSKCYLRNPGYSVLTASSRLS